MSYPMDIEYFKTLIKKYCTKVDFEAPYDESSGDSNLGGERICLVFNMNTPLNETTGTGPFQMAFARHDYKKDKFMSVDGGNKEIGFHNFRDVHAHNVGGHDGKITHYIDDYNLSCFLAELLMDSLEGKK